MAVGNKSMFLITHLSKIALGFLLILSAIINFKPTNSCLSTVMLFSTSPPSSISSSVGLPKSSEQAYIEFESIEAIVKTASRTKFFIEFYSTCLEGETNVPCTFSVVQPCTGSHRKTSGVRVQMSYIWVWIFFCLLPSFLCSSSSYQTVSFHFWPVLHAQLLVHHVLFSEMELKCCPSLPLFLIPTSFPSPYSPHPLFPALLYLSHTWRV